MSSVTDPKVRQAQAAGWCCYAGAVAHPGPCPWHHRTLEEPPRPGRSGEREYAESVSMMRGLLLGLALSALIIAGFLGALAIFT